MTSSTHVGPHATSAAPIRDRRSEASQYQRAILDWIETGRGDAIVEAVAGSGKTTTLEMAWRQVQESHGACRAVFLAFNKSVASELEARLPGMQARTLNSFGYEPTRAWIRRDDVAVSSAKYTGIVHRFLERHATGRDRDNRYLADDLKKVIDLARCGMVDIRDAGALREIVVHHNIGRGFGKVERYLHLIAEMCDTGLEQARASGDIDFIDQLWIPYVVNAPLRQYDWIFVDESQDLNMTQLHLVLRSRAPGGRIVFVGDPKQAIYGFAGADNEAMERVRSATNATLLPLSITYRCARSHVAVARRLVPQLEARSDAPEGVFAEVSIERGLELMQPGDLVLCRETAPAVALQRHLDDRFRDAYVEDEAKHKTLRSQLLRYRSRAVAPADVVAQVEEDVRRLEQGDGTAFDKLDRLDTLRALLAALCGRSAVSYADLETSISRVFTRRSTAVRCMTIHKAKGLEAERVFLIRPDLLPHRYATMAWQQEQEENLLYVALTRARSELYVCQGELAFRYIDEEPPSSQSQSIFPFDHGELGTGWSILGTGNRRLEPTRAQVSRPASGATLDRSRPEALGNAQIPDQPFVIAPRCALVAERSRERFVLRSVILENAEWSTVEVGFALPARLLGSLVSATAACIQSMSGASSLARIEHRSSRFVVQLERLGTGPLGAVAWTVTPLDDAGVIQQGTVTLPDFRLDDLANWLSGEPL